MQIRCAACTKTITLGGAGALPVSCPHCTHAPGPGPFGPYDPVRMIAAGGMGEVFLARHRELGTEVAVKLLPPMPLDTAAAVRERFAREARLTAKVRHPGVVRVHGSDLAGDRPYLVLDFVAGHTLRQLLQDGPVTIDEAARLAAATADVLAAAHEQGVLHRDVKPDNVMVAPDGSVRVLDFGIARAVQDDAPITRTGEILGTPEYMAPEQLLDGPEATTERTDVHALGVLLYELLTGRSPFRGANVFQALKLVESLVPPPPSSHRAGIDTALDAVVQRALQKQPDDRFASARDFGQALATAVPTVASPRRHSSGRSSWRSYLAAGLSGLVFATVAIGLIVREYVVPAIRSGLSANQAAPATVRPVQDQRELRRLLMEGRWWRALQEARSAMAAGEPFAREIAQDAFLLSHHGWPLAAGAPAWLGRCDEAERRLLFGDGTEGPAAETLDPRLLLARGDAAGALTILRASATNGPTDARDRQRLLYLIEHLTGQPTTGFDPDDALSHLLAGETSHHTTRVPVDEPEHWLARRCAAGRRDGDGDGANLAAENAWLYGAGELAVLVDAWLRIAAKGQPALRPLPRATFTILRTRVASSDGADAPASLVLRALLDALHGVDLDLRPLRTVPRAGSAATAAWFVAAANTHADHRVPLLLVGVGLGATPDYAVLPWRDTSPDERTLLDVEANGGR